MVSLKVTVMQMSLAAVRKGKCGIFGRSLQEKIIALHVYVFAGQAD